MAESTEGVRVLLGDQRKGILTLAVPIAIALFVQNLNNIVDSFWVADLCQRAMASLGSITSALIPASRHDFTNVA